MTKNPRSIGARLETPWGKLQRQDPQDRTSPVMAWHPLQDHCADVAACLVALLGSAAQPTAMRQRLAALGHQDHLDDQQVARLGVLAFLHDIGKANRGFQAKAFVEASRDAGHIAEVMVLLCRGDPPLMNALDFPSDWSKGDGTMELLAAAISHHGRPADQPQTLPHPDTVARWWAPGSDGDPMATIQSLVAATRRWLPQAWESGGRPLPTTPGFQHGFCGLVQLADWLGSDTDFFPYSQPGEDRWPRAVEAATAAMAATGLVATAAHAALAVDPPFSAISDFRPHPLQAAVGRLIPAAGPSLTLIEEETGGGKTEAALWHFARLFAAGLVDGLYFALPTRTAATQVHRRVTEAIARSFPTSPPTVILAVPGYLRVDGAEGRPLPAFEVLWNDDPTKVDRHRRWAAEHPKRFLAGTVVVGTIDQALLAALAVDHAHLRSACLLRHLLVVDEVHASDAYMNRLLTALLERTRAAGGHALLMSATLGSVARNAFLGSWGHPTTTSPAEAQAIPYPTLWAVGAPPQVVERTGRDRRVTLTTLEADDPAVIARRAQAAAQAGARVLIIRNTRADCLATQAALESTVAPDLLWRVASPTGLLPVPHHARYAREDRTYLDAGIEAAFGKHAERHGGLIACATQTIQQALDLDADLLITDLAPVDVLLQRLGRLHRHARPRPTGFTDAQAVILSPPDSLATWLGNPRRGPHGWGTVYQDLRILEATRRLVAEGTWAIPQDNRRLVEQATHPDLLAVLTIDDPRWATHGYDQQGRLYALKDRARLGLLPWHRTFGEPEVLFPREAMDGELKTRLGENDRRIVLPTPWSSALGQTIRELTVPGWWCADLPPDAPVRVTRNESCAQIQFGPLRFSYDRLGLRREET